MEQTIFLYIKLCELSGQTPPLEIMTASLCHYDTFSQFYYLYNNSEILDILEKPKNK